MYMYLWQIFWQNAPFHASLLEGGEVRWVQGTLTDITHTDMMD